MKCLHCSVVSSSWFWNKYYSRSAAVSVSVSWD